MFVGRSNIVQRTSLATVAAIALMLGASAFGGAYAQATAPASADSASTVPFPVFKLEPKDPAATSRQQAPTVPPAEAPSSPDNSSAGNGINSQPAPVVDMTPKPGASSSSQTDPTKAVESTAIPTQNPPASNATSEASESIPTAPEPRTQTETMPAATAAPAAVPPPELAMTGLDTNALAALGFLFTAIGLTFFWFSLTPSTLQFAYSSTNFTGKG